MKIDGSGQSGKTKPIKANFRKNECKLLQSFHTRTRFTCTCDSCAGSTGAGTSNTSTGIGVVEDTICRQPSAANRR